MSDWEVETIIGTREPPEFEKADGPPTRKMSRPDIEDFLGWRIVTVSGELLAEGYEPSNVRLQLEAPDGRQRNIYIEVNDDGDGLEFYDRGTFSHQRRSAARLMAEVGKA